jgi:hypothetical protein
MALLRFFRLDRPRRPPGRVGKADRRTSRTRSSRPALAQHGGAVRQSKNHWQASVGVVVRPHEGQVGFEINRMSKTILRRARLARQARQSPLTGASCNL